MVLLKPINAVNGLELVVDANVADGGGHEVTVLPNGWFALLLGFQRTWRVW